MTAMILERPALADDSDRQASRWRALTSRDASADGAFVYSVRTTGVYCRPSCASRAALPENVAFHDSPAAAEKAGFRPCKRCHPAGVSLARRHEEAIEQACRRIAKSESVPSLAVLAKGADLSPHYFHRIFKKVTGITPLEYATSHRAARVEAELRTAPTVTHALYGAGFNSSSRFYAAATKRLGMAPSAYRGGGAGVQILFAVGLCSLGSILVGATAKGICAILMGDDPDRLVRELQDRFPEAETIGGDAAFETLVAQVVGFVEAPFKELSLPLDIVGTAFQQRVWAALQAIPPGKTATYADVAKAIGEPKASRAVAAACGANPIAVAIPCHRVIRSDGSLSGYRWGVERKRDLIARESAHEP